MTQPIRLHDLHNSAISMRLGLGVCLFVFLVYLVPTFAWAQTCGDTICDEFAGECQSCPEDCQNVESEGLCLGNNEGDDGVCTDDPSVLGYPEVSEDGFGCNDPQCPSFEVFCADPAHAGMGVTLCSQAMPCDQGGGTPAQCFCMPTTTECSELEVVDNCSNDCDCIGNEQAGLCEETQCGWQCSLKCQNRRDITFDGAFSSCQMVCPTTRLPEQAGVENEHVRRYIEGLPDYCRGASSCGAERRNSMQAPHSRLQIAVTCIGGLMPALLTAVTVHAIVSQAIFTFALGFEG